jgi:uncharacterized protein YjiS (DUF1127 family)
MTSISHHSPSAFRFAALTKVAGIAATRVVAFCVAIQNRRQVASLLQADPAMLRDLGLTPMDVSCALAEPMWRDPSARLLVWSIERRAASRAAARDNLIGLGADAESPRTRARC